MSCTSKTVSKAHEKTHCKALAKLIQNADSKLITFLIFLLTLHTDPAFDLWANFNMKKNITKSKLNLNKDSVWFICSVFLLQKYFILILKKSCNKSCMLHIGHCIKMHLFLKLVLENDCIKENGSGHNNGFSIAKYHHNVTWLFSYQECD